MQGFVYLVNALMMHGAVDPVDTHVSEEEEAGDAQQQPGPA